MLYEFKNKKTGEKEERIMRVAQRDQYLKDNPHLEQTCNSVPTVKYIGCGWEKNERNPYAKGIDANDNAQREYDALDHDFQKGRGVYKKVNDERARQEEKMYKKAQKDGVDLE